MVKKINLLDKKDEKILVELDKDARQADSEIAKRLSTSKQVVNYRIQKLIENKIISNFYTIVNSGLLGLNSYYIFIQLEKLNKEQESRLLNKINSLTYVGWLVSGTGRWDAIILAYADSINTFDKRLSEIINICGENLHEYNFTTLIDAEHMGYRFLIEAKSLSVKQTEKLNMIKLDEIDKRILEVISQNARSSITEIARLIKLEVHLVNYHLKNLIKEKVIVGFKPKININKLGYQWYLLLIQLQRLDEKRRKEFLQFCKQYKKIYYVTNTVGLYNIMLDIHVKSAEEFKEVLLDLKDKFSDIIKTYETMVIFDEYKISYVSKDLI